jgi:plastocyanin
MRPMLTVCLALVSSVALAGGTVTGQVSFSGESPKAEALNTGTDPACSGARADAVLLGKDGKTLQNVLVRVVDAPVSGPAATERPPVIIQQRGCIYQPRVTVAVTGQQVLVGNGDEALHNVHAYHGKKTLLNRAQLPGTKEIRVEPPAGAEVVQLKCDIHPWMLAHVVVSPSPYFAVTGADGSFRIEGVPAGTWQLEAWHEQFGLKKGQVKVEEGKPATVSFSFP